jgi:hypothetical protein
MQPLKSPCPDHQDEWPAPELETATPQTTQPAHKQSTEPLCPPLFPQANSSNSICPILSPMGTCLKVKPYPAMKIGDAVLACVTFFDRAVGGMQVVRAEFTQTQLVMHQHMQQGLHFFIPRENLIAVGYGRAEAHYRVMRKKTERRSATCGAMIDMRYYSQCTSLTT